MSKDANSNNRISQKDYKKQLLKMLDHLERGKHLPITITQCNQASDLSKSKNLCEVTFFYEIEELDDY